MRVLFPRSCPSGPSSWSRLLPSYYCSSSSLLLPSTTYYTGYTHGRCLFRFRRQKIKPTQINPFFAPGVHLSLERVLMFSVTLKRDHCHYYTRKRRAHNVLYTWALCVEFEEKMSRGQVFVTTHAVENRVFPRSIKLRYYG